MASLQMMTTVRQHFMVLFDSCIVYYYYYYHEYTNCHKTMNIILAMCFSCSPLSSGQF